MVRAGRGRKGGGVMEPAHRHVVPRTLAHAAAAYGQNPRALGEILIVLVFGGEERERALDEGQRAIVAMCREEVAERWRARAHPSAQDEEATAGAPASTTERTIWP